MTIEDKMKKYRYHGTITLVSLLIASSIVFFGLSFMELNRVLKPDLFACLFFLILFLGFSFYFPVREIKQMKDDDDSALHACLYYFLIEIIYILVCLSLVMYSRFVDARYCKSGLAIRLISPLTALFVYGGQHQVPLFFKWIIWKQRELTNKYTTNKKSDGTSMRKPSTNMVKATNSLH